MQTSTNLLSIVLLVALIYTTSGCTGEAQSQNPQEPETPPSVPVEAEAARNGDIAAFFVGTATLEAENEATVVAKTDGIVEEIFVEEGSYVRAGDPLARLDDERVALELARAETNLSQLESTFQRNEELFAKNLISAEEYERVRSEYEAQKAAHDLVRLELEYTTVRAPIQGVVSERLIKPGNMIRTHDRVFRITSFDPLVVVLHVPERELSKLRKGQAAELRMDALPGDVFTGRVERISPVIDPSTGTFQVTVEVRDATNRLKPGMFGRVQIVYDTHEDVVLVPKSAVLPEDDAASVFVVRDSLAIRQIVETGYSDDAHIEILSGLEEGDLVVTTGQSSLRDSTRVEVLH